MLAQEPGAIGKKLGRFSRHSKFLQAPIKQPSSPVLPPLQHSRLPGTSHSVFAQAADAAPSERDRTGERVAPRFAGTGASLGASTDDC